MKKEYFIDVEWTNKGQMRILAKSESEAVKLAKNEADLPESYDLIPTSVRVIGIREE